MTEHVIQGCGPSVCVCMFVYVGCASPVVRRVGHCSGGGEREVPAVYGVYWITSLPCLPRSGPGVNRDYMQWAPPASPAQSALPSPSPLHGTISRGVGP